MLFRIKYQYSQLDAPLLPTMAHMLPILLRQSVIQIVNTTCIYLCYFHYDIYIPLPDSASRGIEESRSE